MNKVTQEIRDAIASNNIENIRAKIQDLKNILAEISTQAYQSAGASSAQAGTAGQGLLVVDQQEVQLDQQEVQLDQTPRHNNI